MIVFQIVNNISIDSFGGGAEMFALRLAEKVSEDLNSHVISVWHYGTDKERQITESLQGKVVIHYLLDAIPMKKADIVTLYRKLKKIFTSFPPTVINSHSPLPDVVNLFIKLFMGHKVKAVRTMHTDKEWVPNKCLENWTLNIFPFIFDSEVAISRATKIRLDERPIAKLLKKQSVFIPNGISEGVMNYLKDNPIPARAQNSYKLVTVGRLTEQKGYKYLIEAIRILSDSYILGEKNISLSIIGEGHLKTELLLLTDRYNLTDKIHFLGYRQDVLQIVASSDLFVSSSLWEGIPTVLLEAMALNVPIIATNIPGTKELIVDRQTGILVKPKSPEQLARAISEFVTNPDTSRPFIEAANSYVREYSMVKVKEKYLDIYSS